ncbi:MAG TPA: DUF2493 domain-containing protein [Solimonas sp.]|nr:DUF2493 domain-containing protein [Solimonas sp.]
MTRAIVCGGRHFNDRAGLFAALDMLHDLRPFTEIIHGAATGADTLAGEWAASRKVKQTPVPANWDRLGRAAGMRRNLKMLYHAPDLVVAFPGGKGTQNMIDLAEGHDVPVVRAGGAR